ncbi:hypothetical protein HPP92_027863 [Vanilla planifolia]|uniref:Uncharacterized protein n=1 Tax=Vanilla planifolia TaxID=51239 RepID=A0A835PBB4_VANPL|nr:hypothetical protein HPP92_027863 [Vanilla planifolia]
MAHLAINNEDLICYSVLANDKVKILDSDTVPRRDCATFYSNLDRILLAFAHVEGDWLSWKCFKAAKGSTKEGQGKGAVKRNKQKKTPAAGAGPKTAAVIEKTVQTTVQEVTVLALQVITILDQVGSGPPGVEAIRPRPVPPLLTQYPLSSACGSHTRVHPKPAPASVYPRPLRKGLDIVRADVFSGLDESKNAMAMVTEPLFALCCNYSRQRKTLSRCLRNLGMWCLEARIWFAIPVDRFLKWFDINTDISLSAFLNYTAPELVRSKFALLDVLLTFQFWLPCVPSSCS